MYTIRYLSPVPIFSSPRLQVRGVGIRETMPAHFVDRPQGTGDYLFMFFHDAVDWGPATRRVKLLPGTMVFWSRGAPHYYGDPRARWRHSWIHCDGADVDEIIANSSVPTDTPIRQADTSVVAESLFDVHQELVTVAPPDPVILRNLIENLVREGARGESRPAKRPAPVGLERARQFIETHYPDPMTLDQLASIAGLSPRHFCTEFRRHYGLSPINHLIHKRLQTAAGLLRGTSAGIAEIGRQVGYPDPYYFSKHFKACFGAAPSHLRAERPAGNRTKWGSP